MTGSLGGTTSGLTTNSDSSGAPDTPSTSSCFFWSVAHYAEPEIMPSEESSSVHTSALPSAARGDTSDLFLAITESKLASQVTRGENAGLRLEHTAVVRDLKKIARLNPSQEFTADFTVPLLSEWKVENLRAVVFVQELRSRRVLGAAQTRLAGQEEAGATLCWDVPAGPLELKPALFYLDLGIQGRNPETQSHDD